MNCARGMTGFSRSQFDSRELGRHSSTPMYHLRFRVSKKSGALSWTAHGRHIAETFIVSMFRKCSQRLGQRRVCGTAHRAVDARPMELPGQPCGLSVENPAIQRHFWTLFRAFRSGLHGAQFSSPPHFAGTCFLMSPSNTPRRISVGRSLRYLQLFLSQLLSVDMDRLSGRLRGVLHTGNRVGAVLGS